MTKARKPKAKSLRPSLEQVRLEVFAIADSPPPLTGGHYWCCPEHQLLRGPFATREAAEADFGQFGTQLLGVIVDATVVDVTSADLQTAAALIKEFGEEK
jgi:hypothetical protein